MRTSIIFTALLFTLIITSCDECTLFPPVSNYEVGDTLWIHELPGKDSLFINSSLAIGKDGSIYYGASGGTVWWNRARIFALNKDDGSVKWVSDNMDHNALGSQIVVGDDGTIYAIGYYTLYAIDPVNGAFKWKWEVPVTVATPDYPNGLYTYGQIGALALTNEGDLILGSIGGGVYSRGLYGISKSGSTKFVNLDANGVGILTGIYIGKNNTAYYYSQLSGKYYLVSANSNTGAMGWTLEIGGWGNGSNNIAIQDDGNLFCSFKKPGDDKYRNHIVNATNGSILWSGTFEAQIARKFIGTDGKCYENPHYIFEVDKTNDKLTQIVSANMGAISDNNRIVSAFTDADHKRKLGVFYPDGLIDFSVNMDGLEGFDLVISDDKVIYGIINRPSPSRIPDKICAIQGNAKLAGTGWPRISHDNRNTSNSSK